MQSPKSAQSANVGVPLSILPGMSTTTVTLRRVGLAAKALYRSDVARFIGPAVRCTGSRLRILPSQRWSESQKRTGSRRGGLAPATSVEREPLCGPRYGVVREVFRSH